MQGKMKINEDITVGGQPSEHDLRQIKEEGFKSIINLRHKEEENLPMTPEKEGEKVRLLDMQYANIPVSMENASAELVNSFRRKLKDMAKPVFVHCGKGKRAGAFSMMDIAISQGMSGEETIKKAEDMGFECDNEKLINFVKEYIDSHHKNR